jgi:hypothetical protein
MQAQTKMASPAAADLIGMFAQRNPKSSVSGVFAHP